MNDEMKHLTKLSVKDLAKKIVCDGHLFLISGDRKFYLMKPGVFVDPLFIKKHAIKDQIFDFELVINLEIKERFKQLFKELRYLQFERDLRLKCVEIMKYFFEVYSSGAHFLSFALACHEEFCQISFDNQKKMHDSDIHLFRKSLYSSAFSVLVSMTNDFYYFAILKDFYHVSFLLDFGLCEENYSYHVAEACNYENREPGHGIEYLEEQKASQLEKDVFLKHPERSFESIKKNMTLSYPELSEITLYQHELADGKGFPRGIKKGQISVWEAVVIFSDSLVEISSEYTFETDVVSYLLNFKNQKMKDLPVGRVYKKMCGAFEHFHGLKATGS